MQIAGPTSFGEPREEDQTGQLSKLSDEFTMVRENWSRNKGFSSNPVFASSTSLWNSQVNPFQVDVYEN